MERLCGNLCTDNHFGHDLISLAKCAARGGYIPLAREGVGNTIIYGGITVPSICRMIPSPESWRLAHPQMGVTREHEEQRVCEQCAQN